MRYADRLRRSRAAPLLRWIKRRLIPAPSLPLNALRARIELQGPPPALQRPLIVAVTNLSARTWPAGLVSASYHWHRADGSVWMFDGERIPLPRALEPGQAVPLEWSLRGPNTPGSYVLEVDLVCGPDTWFGRAGSLALRLEVVLGGLQPESLPEIDYEQAYGHADLAKDYWTIVGPSSPDEFRQLGLAKLRMLQDLGLGPGSRVLDVGCGTGSLTEALAGFLDEEGFYFGTDLSDVAVRFCRERYGRANFTFAQNAMTSLPLDEQRFDFVVFFSVFTHTYPPETRALLAEAARLLEAGGAILADVFESDLEGDSLGTRAMLVLDRRRMPALVEELGLEARTISTFVWDSQGDRTIDRVMRRLARRPAAGAP